MNNKDVPLREPVLPYGNSNPSSGFSGSTTSEAAVRAEDADGRTRDKQQAALNLLSQAVTVVSEANGLDLRYAGAAYGMTWRELDSITDWGHGSTSRVLSDLHKAGRIARLTEERNRCKVYVLPKYVNGRDTEAHGSRKVQLPTLEDAYVAGYISDNTGILTPEDRAFIVQRFRAWIQAHTTP